MAQGIPHSRNDFDEIYREQLIFDAAEQDRITAPQAQFESGTVSALDMNAPVKAVKKLREANSLLKEQKAKEAVHYLEDAIEAYPKFVSAHIVPLFSAWPILTSETNGRRTNLKQPLTLMTSSLSHFCTSA
jgi:hypothetical protein